ncbi:hypothetical protein NEOKW01_0237 [Nematocida sp. AWRm80]|nr:hypothetical protein NEOKW01_0237 [Nematocida sp. AWRm80]
MTVPQPAVKRGGKKAARRVVVKKTVVISPETKIKNALASSEYRTQEIKDVENCSFMSSTGAAVNYTRPEVTAIYQKNGGEPIGYLLKGDGEMLNGGAPQFDMETIATFLKNKGVNVDDLAEKVKNGDHAALEKIITLLKNAKLDGEDQAEDKAEEGQAEDKTEEKEQSTTETPKASSD